MISTKQDFEVMGKIANRAIEEKILPASYVTIIMDLEATHEDVGLALNELLATNPGDFAHDLCGIYSNMNRNTGKIENAFSPRYAKCYH